MADRSNAALERTDKPLLTRHGIMESRVYTVSPMFGTRHTSEGEAGGEPVPGRRTKSQLCG